MTVVQTFKQKYGPWALITGAAWGMGAEYSRQIGAMGLNLVLVDMRGDDLRKVADEVRRGGRVEVREVVTDLSRPDFMSALRPATDGLEIGLLVSNAAHLPVGLFFEQSLEDKIRMIEVNCRAPLILVHEFGAKMLARRRGGIILMSSGSATQGVAYIASYAATKAYNLVLAESLWDELREHGVDVLGFMPGATRTTGFELSKPRLERSAVAPVNDPKPTVAEALRVLGKTPSWIPGRRNRWILTLAQRLLPRKQMIKLVSSNMRQWYGR
ncbi:MAG: SDR family NAD(P)-dependent oxidoreductase [Dehalococcoidia bacterium]|nr:SDR family NAD(P)-dependent oxidoreductase [Dehalococcoidia bacterium]